MSNDLKKKLNSNKKGSTEEKNTHILYLNVHAHTKTHTHTLNLEAGPQSSFTRKPVFIHSINISQAGISRATSVIYGCIN